MKQSMPRENFTTEPNESLCDFLILSDGTLLSHNLTPSMAEALQFLNPADETLRRRAAGGSAAAPAVPDPRCCP
jgi:hypothetical protein